IKICHSVSLKSLLGLKIELDIKSRWRLQRPGMKQRPHNANQRRSVSVKFLFKVAKNVMWLLNVSSLAAWLKQIKAARDVELQDSIEARLRFNLGFTGARVYHYRVSIITFIFLQNRKSKSISEERNVSNATGHQLIAQGRSCLYAITGFQH